MTTVLITPPAARHVRSSSDVPTVEDLRGDDRIEAPTVRRRRPHSPRNREPLAPPQTPGINRGSATNLVMVSLATALGSATSIPAHRAVIQAGVLSSGSVIALALLSCRALGANGQRAAGTHLVCAFLCTIPIVVGLVLDNADVMIGNMTLAVIIWTAALGC